MTAHLQVYMGKRDGWISWCQASSFMTEGRKPHAQFALHDLAGQEGLHLVCAQRSLEEAQAAVEFLKKHRPHVQFRAVDGPCQAPRYPTDYDDNWTPRRFGKPIEPEYEI